MFDDKEEINIKDKNGNQINISVDVPPAPQPQIILETFEYHKSNRKDDSPSNNGE